MDKAHSSKKRLMTSLGMIVLRDARTPEEKTQRRKDLQNIMRKLDDEMQFYTNIQLVRFLHKRGWKCNRSTIYRDRRAINKTNTWVQDLGESTYSARQEQIDNLITYTITEAKKMYQKQWTITKAVRKTTPKGEIIEAHTTAEIPGAKNMFLKSMQTGADLLMKHTNGENVNRSVAMLASELDESHLVIEKLKSKLLEKGENIEKILSAQGQDNILRH